MTASSVTTSATWLYVNRNGETVRLTVRSAEASHEIRMAGPAHNRASYQFADAILLIRHQSTIEAELLTQGYALEHFVTDRRSGADRRAYPRRIDRERRRD